jgi:probable F420-dependent oxidoreductase
MSNVRPFRFGIAVSEDVPSRDEWIRLARRTEDLGYATFLVADHFINEYLPITALMFAADVTRTLRIGSYVFDNNYRHPVLLAKEVAALDRLSGGRFELGLGAGWLRADYEQVGLPFDPPLVRIQRLEEGVSILKQFFTQDSVTFAGEHYKVTGLQAFPKPAQRPHPPLFIGGGGKRVLTLAGREANIVGLIERLKDDGTFDASEATEAALARKVEWVQQAAGERFLALELNMLIAAVILTEDREQAAEQRARERGKGATVEGILANPHLLIGTVEQMVETLQRRREQLGISYLTVLFRDMDVFAPVVARLAGK